MALRTRKVILLEISCRDLSLDGWSLSTVSGLAYSENQVCLFFTRCLARGGDLQRDVNYCRAERRHGSDGHTAPVHVHHLRRRSVNLAPWW